MFRKLSELLESGDITAEVAAAINTEIETSEKKIKDEREALSVKNKELTHSFTEIQKAKDLLEAKTGDIDAQIKKAKEDGKSEIVTSLEAEKAKNTELVEQIAGFGKENERLKLDTAVSKALDSFDVRKDDKELVSHFLRSKVSITDDKVMYDGMPLDAGFKTYFESNQARLNPKGDSNGSGGNEGGGSGGTLTKTRDDFEKMDAGHKAKFMADGGTLK